MELVTPRLLLRPWEDSDAQSLFACAKDPDVGPRAGWPPHASAEESLRVIRSVLSAKECYAICEKDSDAAIGAVELMLNGHTELTHRDDECELGFWLGKPFWGRGYMPEAARELLRHGFEDLGMTAVWCAYSDGNAQSKRVQEKLGFQYHHTRENIPVPLLGGVRTQHVNRMTREQWNACAAGPQKFGNGRNA